MLVDGRSPFIDYDHPSKDTKLNNSHVFEELCNHDSSNAGYVMIPKFHLIAG